MPGYKHPMLNRLAFAPLLALLTLASCGGSSSSIPVRGPDEDVGLMAGHWEGTYVGVESGRHGTVLFDLTLGHHVAAGNVLMQAEGQPQPGQALAVEFVHADHGQVQGKIRPYTDPVCQCTIDTEFLGELHGDEISGTFTSKLSTNGNLQHGTWEVHRK